jgi:hypothetical protein
MKAMQVVSPYRPFPPESKHHQVLGPFDWVGAFRMMADSVDRSCHCEARIITDWTTTCGVPSYHFETTETRLMLWMLEVSLRFLESEHFDRNTAMVCPDVLVYGDISKYFRGDLGLIVRLGEKFQAKQKTFINGTQWWAIRAKPRLIEFYRQALDVAKTLPESSIVWGADTESIRQLVHPMCEGLVKRAGLTIQMVPYERVMTAFPSSAIDHLQGRRLAAWPTVPLMDFRARRKLYMRAFYDATYGRRAA